jgi:3-hydroxyanthranilate 3,4-dioxygenase
MWFCANCDHKLYEEFLHVADIVEDLPPVFERFNANAEARTCARCGTVAPPR